MQYFDMIRTHHDHSNVSITSELGIISSQFYMFLRHYSSKVSWFLRWSISLSFWRLPSKDSLWDDKRFKKRNFFWFLFCLLPFVCYTLYCLPHVPPVLFFPFMFPLVQCKVLASIVAKSSCCFQICNINIVCRVLGTMSYTHDSELMKSVSKVTIEMPLTYMVLLMMITGQVRGCHFCLYC